MSLFKILYISHQIKTFVSVLRDRLTPKRISLVLETWDLRRQCFTHCLSLLIPTFSFLIFPFYITIKLLKFTERSATIYLYKSITSVNNFSSVHFQCKKTKPMSCYAFFKGWLLLSLPFGCQHFLTILSLNYF